MRQQPLRRRGRGKDGVITKLKPSCLPIAVGLTEERRGEKEGKGSRTGGGGENKEERKIFNCNNSY